MTLKCKKSRPLTREERPLRDARLFIIATEDKFAPEQYFRLFKNPRIKIQVLPTTDGRSAPAHVLERLNTFRDDYVTIDEDEFWLMLDIDHWTEAGHIANFNLVCQEAIQRGYHLAHSNPCFEIWLLMHVFPLDAGTQYKRCNDVVSRLREVLGNYSKRSINADHFPESSIKDAVSRAEATDHSSGDRWPQSTGTHVYKIVKRLINWAPIRG